MVNIPTKEIPSSQWWPYFDVLNELYGGWRITVDVLIPPSATDHPPLGEQRVIDGLPLQGLSYETAGTEAGNILVSAGDPEPYVMHRIARPRIVRIAFLQPGAETDVEIEAEDGTSTLIMLRPSPALPPGSRQRETQRAR